MTIVIFVAILAILIISHELGHFLIAKWSGSRVDEFGLGFPPRIWGYKKGETIYSINWIPFGGFVKIFGEDPTKDATTDERSLANKPALWQAAVLVAGVTFNLIFAWILFTVGFATVGLPVSTSELPVNYQASNFSVTIVGVLPESPASDAGIKMGDKIKALTVGANRVVAPKVAEVQALIKNSNKKSVVLEYERNNKMEVVSILPRELKTGLGIGVSLDEIGNLKLPLGSAMVAGARSTWSSLVFTAQSFGELFASIGKGESEILKQVSGPVGIVGLVGEASNAGLASLILLTSLISINLAVLNLLPFPALDGGRLVILGIEAIVRRKIKPSIVNGINLVGFFLLILMMLAVTFSDIVKLI